MPIATLTTLALRVVTRSSKTQVRTHRAEVHEAWEGDEPDILGVDDITTIKLEEPALDT